MNCPVCDGRLRAIEKYGVEVDICPDCKGVWLDRGELDKILQMDNEGGPVQYREEKREEKQPERREYESKERDHREERKYDDKRDDERRDYDPKYPHKKKRGSWLGEIFESFGGGD